MESFNSKTLVAKESGFWAKQMLNHCSLHISLDSVYKQSGMILPINYTSNVDKAIC